MSLPDVTRIDHAPPRCWGAQHTRWSLEDVPGLRLIAAAASEQISDTPDRRKGMRQSFERENSKLIVFFNKPFSVRDDASGQKQSFDVRVAFGTYPLEGIDGLLPRAGAACVKCAGALDYGFTRLMGFSDPTRSQVGITCRMVVDAKSPDPEEGAACRIQRKRAGKNRQRKEDPPGAGALDKRKIAEFYDG